MGDRPDIGNCRSKYGQPLPSSHDRIVDHIDRISARGVKVTVAGKDAAGVFSYSAPLQANHFHPQGATSEYLPGCIMLDRQQGSEGFHESFSRLEDYGDGVLAIETPQCTYLATMRNYHYIEECVSLSFAAFKPYAKPGGAIKHLPEPTPEAIAQYGYQFAFALLVDHTLQPRHRPVFLDLCIKWHVGSERRGVTAEERLVDVSDDQKLRRNPGAKGIRDDRRSSPAADFNRLAGR
jgi:hypothetical protein